MRKYLSLILLLIASACAPQVNTADSPIEDKTGLSKGHMLITFRSYYNNAKVTAVANDGEVFSGMAINPRSEYLSGEFLSTRFSSRSEAVLIGNKGHSMKCNFLMAEPSYGITAGGIGDCKTSDGKTIPVTFTNKR